MYNVVTTEDNLIRGGLFVIMMWKLETTYFLDASTLYFFALNGVIV